MIEKYDEFVSRGEIIPFNCKFCTVISDNDIVLNTQPNAFYKNIRAPTEDVGRTTGAPSAPPTQDAITPLGRTTADTITTHTTTTTTATTEADSDQE